MESIAMWRATYTPGTWVALAGPTALVVLRPAPADASALLNRLWDDIAQAASVEDLAATLASFRVDTMPQFGAFFWSGDGLNVLVRGLQVMDPHDGAIVADGGGAHTWREVNLADTPLVRVQLEPVDQESVLQLPLLTGCVLASALQLDASSETRLSLPTRPAATAGETTHEESPALAPQGPGPVAGTRYLPDPEPSAEVVAAPEPEAEPLPEPEAAAEPLPEAEPVQEGEPVPGVEPVQEADPEPVPEPPHPAAVVAEPENRPEPPAEVAAAAVPPVVVGPDVPAGVASAEALVASLWGVADAEVPEPVAIDVEDEPEAAEAEAPSPRAGLDLGDAAPEPIPARALDLDDPALPAGRQAPAQPGAARFSPQQPSAPAFPPAQPVPGAVSPAQPGQAQFSPQQSSAPAFPPARPGPGAVSPAQPGPAPFSPQRPPVPPPQSAPGAFPFGGVPGPAQAGVPGFPGFPGSRPQSSPSGAPARFAGPASMPAPGSRPGSPSEQPYPSSGRPGQFGPPPGQPAQFGPAPGQPGQFGPPPGQFGQPGQGRPPAAAGSFGSPPQGPGQFGPPPGQFGPPPGPRSGPGQAGPPPGAPTSATRPYPPGPGGPVGQPSPGSSSAPPWPAPAHAGDEDDVDGGTIFSTSIAQSHKPAAAIRPAGGFVLAGVCANGHPNPLGLAVCRRCGSPVDTANPKPVERPAMATLVTSDGARANLVDTVLVGRSPSAQHGDTMPILLPVPSPNGDISRTHVRVAAKDWDIVVTDISTNGTMVTRPGEPPSRLNPGSPTVVPIGTVIDLGDGALVTVADPD